MVTIKRSYFRGDRCGARTRRRVSVFKGSFLCLKKIAGQNQPVSWVSPTAHRNILAFLRRRVDLQIEQHVAGEFLASNFLDENKSRQQREFVFGSSISPPEKARIFSYKKMYSNISLLSTWVALAGNRHKTPRDSSSTAKRHLSNFNLPVVHSGRISRYLVLCSRLTRNVVNVVTK